MNTQQRNGASAARPRKSGGARAAGWLPRTQRCRERPGCAGGVGPAPCLPPRWTRPCSPASLPPNRRAMMISEESGARRRTFSIVSQHSWISACATSSSISWFLISAIFGVSACAGCGSGASDAVPRDGERRYPRAAAQDVAGGNFMSSRERERARERVGASGSRVHADGVTPASDERPLAKAASWCVPCGRRRQRAASYQAKFFGGSDRSIT